MRHYAFTMIELVFVIVIMGILSKFGAEFLAQAYNGFIFSKINNELQSKSESTIEQIASRLQFRIKASVIGRDPNNNNFLTNFKSPSEIPLVDVNKYSVLEWVGIADDSFRGTTTPLWSGIIDVDQSKALGDKTLVSPETNTTAIDNLITVLSHNSGTGINDSAIYFIGSDSNIRQGFGWDKVNHKAMHRIDANSTNINWLVADNNFSDVDVYEYYQLAWTAYAVGIDDYNTSTNAGTNSGTLKLWYDYQPWEGEGYTDNTTKSIILMEHVSSFQYNAIGSILKIQVCTKSTFEAMSEGNYSLCKEKTVY